MYRFYKFFSHAHKAVSIDSHLPTILFHILVDNLAMALKFTSHGVYQIRYKAPPLQCMYKTSSHSTSTQILKH